MTYDCPETERAVSLHLQWCERNGLIPDQPCSALSKRREKTVTLANSRRVLGRYHVTQTGRLRRVQEAQ